MIRISEDLKIQLCKSMGERYIYIYRERVSERHTHRQEREEV